MDTSEMWRVIPDFPTKIFKDNYSLPGPTTRGEILGCDNLSDEVQNFMSARGLNVHSMILFNLYVPNHLGTIHHDIALNGDVIECAINIELSGKSEMHFFEQTEVKELITDKAGYIFARYNPQDMTRIGCLEYDANAYLVRVGFPHRAKAIQTPRQLITLRFGSKNKFTTWKEAVQCLFVQ